jgi:transcriptional regulator GlxA family with amidase domain
VHAIARRWGFDDAAHFSKIFKACYGEPPGAYRQRASTECPVRECAVRQ